MRSQVRLYSSLLDRSSRAHIANAISVAHKAPCDEGGLHGRISPETVFVVETATEQDSAGSLDVTHIEEGGLGLSGPMVAVNDTVRVVSHVSDCAA